MAHPERYDTVIIGAGPAGLSAALVLGRCLRSVLVCDSGRYRNERSHALHAYMGHDGIPPHELLRMGRRQLEPYGTVTLRCVTALNIARTGPDFLVRLETGEAARTRTVLVATGVVDELPEVDGIRELFGRSVHVCPYCDGWEHRSGPIAVYGRGQKGAKLASLLRQWTSDLVLCTDGVPLPKDDRAATARRGISVEETPIERLEGVDGYLKSIHFVGGRKLQRCALFFSTDQHPRSPLLAKLGCRFEDNGGVACDETGATSLDGVFVAGDVSRDVQLAIIAAAEGARAALAINKMLLEAAPPD